MSKSSPKKSQTTGMKQILGAITGAFAERAQRQAASAKQPVIRFETMESRVLLSGDVNPVAMAISGSLDVPGEKDVYEFNLQEPTRVVFDILTDRVDMKWKLEGSDRVLQDRYFSQAEHSVSGTDHLLAAGQYRLTVDGNGTAVGKYEMRVLDADSASDLLPGATVKGQLLKGNEVVVYRFNATAGDKFFYDAKSLSANARWKIIGPFGQQLEALGNASEDSRVFQARNTGSYFFVLIGDNANTADLSYEFSLKPVQDSLLNLSLNQYQHATVIAPGQMFHYDFQLEEAQELMFDGFSDITGLRWQLHDSQGEVTQRLSMGSTSPHLNGSHWMKLPAGRYRLSLEVIAENNPPFFAKYVGDFDFRLLARNAATAITPNQAIQGSLPPSRKALYSLQLEAGEEFLMDGVSASNQSISWTLLNSLGVSVAGSGSLLKSLARTTIPASGHYWLLLDDDSSIYSNQTASYHFVPRIVRDIQQNISIGSELRGNLTHAGQQAVYSFELGENNQLVLDVLSKRTDMEWALFGPQGTVVEFQNFFKWGDAVSTPMAERLPPGSYRLVVRGVGNASGEFVLKLHDLEVAETINLGSKVVGRLNNGNSSQAYTFQAQAGDSLGFVMNSMSVGNARWHLFDPSGRRLIDGVSLRTSLVPLTLGLAGKYKILIDGAATNSAPLDFDLQWNVLGNTPQSLPDGEEISLGNAFAGNFTRSGESRVHRFSLNKATTLSFDLLQFSHDIKYQLISLRGQEIQTDDLYHIERKNKDSLLKLPAGEYALVLTSTRSQVQYKLVLHDINQYPTIPLGELITAEHNPRETTLAWRFDAQVKQVFNLSLSGGLQNYRIFDPYGKSVMITPNVDWIQGKYKFVADIAGTYLLMARNENHWFNNDTSQVKVAVEEIKVGNLVFDSPMQEKLSGLHQRVSYKFDLTQDQTLILKLGELISDNPYNSNGIQVYWYLRSEAASTRMGGWTDATYAEGRTSFLDLPAGSYQLELYNAVDSTNEVKFSLHTKNSATNLSIAETVQDVFSIADSSKLYRFNGKKDQQIGVYTDNMDISSEAWKLFDPYGKEIENGSLINFRTGIKLPVDGEYLFVAYARNRLEYDMPFEFSLQTPRTVQQDLVLNQPTVASFGKYKTRHIYRFNLEQATLMMLEFMSGDVHWKIRRPNGVEMFARSKQNPFWVFSAPAGDYEIEIDGEPSSWCDFSVNNIQPNQKITQGESAKLQFQENNQTQALLLEIGETQELVLNQLGADSWRIVSETGRTYASGDSQGVSPKFSLVKGSYYLLIKKGSVGQVDLAILQPGVQRSSVTLDNQVQGRIAHAGQVMEYQFTLDGAHRVLLDRFASNRGLIWTLEGPQNSLYDNKNFLSLSAYDDVLSLLKAGQYTLRIWSTLNHPTEFKFRLNDMKKAWQNPSLSSEMISISLEPGASRIFAFELYSGDLLTYNPINVPEGLKLSVYDEKGRSIVFQRDARLSDALNLSPGRYYLLLQNVSGNQSDIDCQFQFGPVRDQQATLLLDGQLVNFQQINEAAITPIASGIYSASLPAKSNQWLRIDAIQGQTYKLTLPWHFSAKFRMIGPRGNEISYAKEKDVLGMHYIDFDSTGKYYILLENSYNHKMNVEFYWRLLEFSDLQHDTVISGHLDASSTIRYRFQLDSPTWLAFDAMNKNFSLNWELYGPDGQYFDQEMLSQSYHSWYVPLDPAQFLPAGRYFLTLRNTENKQADFRFQTLSATGKQALVSGQKVTGNLQPGQSMQVFPVEVNAGDAFYFVALGSNQNPYWRLYDSVGGLVFSTSKMQSQYNSVKTSPLTLPGRYYLVLEGLNDSYYTEQKFEFIPYLIPQNSLTKVAMPQAQPVPDLHLNALELDPASSLETGQSVRLQWIVENRGLRVTSGNWNDRITLRNLDSGKILAEITVPYLESEHGALGINQAITRNYQLRLPEGVAAVGRLGISVHTDADHVIQERNPNATGEMNNLRQMEVQVSLAQYADLALENVRLNPDGNFAPGQLIQVDWNTLNRGKKAITQAFSERVELWNLNANEMVAFAVLRDSLSDGEFAVGSSRGRIVQLQWPEAALSSGQFALRISLDSANEVLENEIGGESNNLHQVLRSSGPDLQIRDLQAEQASVEAGSLVNLRWQTFNAGGVATPISFNDRVRVKNKSTGEVLLDTSLLWDSAKHGQIAANSGVERSFSFRLPEGASGIGEIEVSVTADQNTTGLGLLYEANFEGDAEENNQRLIDISGVAKTYADLQVADLQVSPAAVSGSMLQVNWQVTNLGAKNATGSWNDQIILSRDAVFGNADDVLLATVRHNAGLLVGENYRAQANVILPQGLEGAYYVGVKLDADNQVLELDTYVNNQRILPINISLGSADLLPSLTLVPTHAPAGREVRIEWAVQNIGNLATDAEQWLDQVYISSSQSLDVEVRRLGSLTHHGALAAGAQYTAGLNVLLPFDVAGPMYFFVKTDFDASVDEGGRVQNNTVAAAKVSQILPESRADLKITDLQAPVVWQVGESIKVQYRITNAGNEHASARIDDRLRLVNQLDPGNVLNLKQIRRNIHLAPGESELLELSFIAPNDAQANWSLELQTDVGDVIRELRDDDNMAALEVRLSHPNAQPDNSSYPANALFNDAKRALPGYVAQSQAADLQTVLAPFALRGWGDGFARSDADIGALAMLQLPDQNVLVSAGALQNQLFLLAKEGGRMPEPLLTLPQPILDMALDGQGQLWLLSGNELLHADLTSGNILRRIQAPNGLALTQALALHAETGMFYLSSENGIEIFDPKQTEPGLAWKQFSNERVGDLAFGPDGRLWAVRLNGGKTLAASAQTSSEILSIVVSGQNRGRTELEYRVAGVVNSLAFGQRNTALDGLLLLSANQAKPTTVASKSGMSAATVHAASVWMIELKSRSILQLAGGGTHGESIVATPDGRILLAQTNRIDELALMKAPKVIAVSVPDGGLMPLPLNRISVSFDQDMWQGPATTVGSVLNPASYRLTTGKGVAAKTVLPQAVAWDAATRSAVLSLDNLQSGQYQLEVEQGLFSASHHALEHKFSSSFTALLNMNTQIRLEFINSGTDSSNARIAYDVKVVNIGDADISGPLTLLLDAGEYFKHSLSSVTPVGQAQGLWMIDISAALRATGGKLVAGASLSTQAVGVTAEQVFGVSPQVVKYNLSHGVYAAPIQNLPPKLYGPDELPVEAGPIPPLLVLPKAKLGQAYSVQVYADDADGKGFSWELLQAPQGMRLDPVGQITQLENGYRNIAKLSWTPSGDVRQDTEVVLKVVDSWGGVAIRRFGVAVDGNLDKPTPVALNTALVMGHGTVGRLDLAKLVSGIENPGANLSVGQPTHGQLQRQADGSYSYTPKEGFIGKDSFVYEVSVNGQSLRAKVNITVRAPVAQQKYGASIGLQSGLPSKVGSLSQVAASALLASPTKAQLAVRAAYPVMSWHTLLADTQSANSFNRAWLNDFLGLPAKSQDMAKHMGLKINLQDKNGKGGGKP